VAGGGRDRPLDRARDRLAGEGAGEDGDGGAGDKEAAGDGAGGGAVAVDQVSGRKETGGRE